MPYYRLYDQIIQWHHWTTDRNEYFTLRANTGRYVAEGVDGYIFKTQPAGTTPWYRLLYPGIAGLHHWTADQNERNSLIGTGFWIEEQKEYVIPPSKLLHRGSLRLKRLDGNVLYDACPATTE